MKDHELTQFIASGNENAASELINNYGPMIRYIISPILSDKREREECFNDVVMRAVEKIGSYSVEKGSFKSSHICSDALGIRFIAQFSCTV